MPSSALPKKRINTSQRNEEETSNSELRPSAGAFATSSRALTSNHTLEDDQKQEYASSSGGVTTATNTSTTQSSTKTPLSPSPAPIQVSKKRRDHHEHEGRFSFREPFLEKVWCVRCIACVGLGLLFANLVYLSYNCSCGSCWTTKQTPTAAPSSG